LLGAALSDGEGFEPIVVTNVIINVIYNFDKNGLSKVIYDEKVIYLFSKIIVIFWNYFFKNPIN